MDWPTSKKILKHLSRAFFAVSDASVLLESVDNPDAVRACHAMRSRD